MAKKLAVLVGCNYPGTEDQLEGCINDVLGMQKILVDRFGFEEDNITVLIDDDANYTMPTGQNITHELASMVAQAQSGDVLFFHFSGHGTRVPSLAGIDDDTGYDECLVPCDMDLITDDNLREVVDNLPPGVCLTVVSDSCHSGGLINNAKEQIGDSSQGKYRLRDAISDNIHEAFQERGIQLPSFGFGHRRHVHRHADQSDDDFQDVAYDGDAAVRLKSRALPLSSLIRVLKQQTGNEDLDVDNVRPTLRELARSKARRIVNVIRQKARGFKDSGILLSACQSSQTCADVQGDDPHGVMSRAVQMVLSEGEGPITNYAMVMRVRQILESQGYSKQSPGLYCTDENANAPFIC